MRKAVLMWLIFWLTGLVALSPNLTSQHIRSIKASSWQSWRPFHVYYYSDECDEVTNQIGLKDDLLLRFNQPVDTRELKKSLRIREMNSQQPVKFILVTQHNREIGIKIKETLKKGSTLKISLDKEFFADEWKHLQEDNAISFFLHTTPKFVLKRWWGRVLTFNDKPYVVLQFSNSLGTVEKKHFKVILVKTQSPTKTETKNIPVPFSLRLNQWKHSLTGSSGLLQLDINRPVDFIETYRVQVSEGFKNQYGEILGKKAEIEFIVYEKKLEPLFQSDFIGDSIRFQLNNIKYLELTLYQLDHHLPAYLRKYISFTMPSGNTRNIDLVGSYPGVLSEEGTLNHVIRLKKIKTIAIDNLGHDEMDFNFKKETGAENGYFGVMVNKVEPFLAAESPGFYNYLKRKDFPFQIMHRRTLDFVLKTDGQKSLVWCYHKRKNQLPGQIDILLNCNGKTRQLKADRDGDLFRLDTGIKPGDIVMVVDPGHQDTAYCPVKYPERIISDSYSSIWGIEEGKVFTDRDVYLPSDTIHIAGIIKFYKGFKINEEVRQLPGTPGLPLILTITGPDKNQLRQVNTYLDPWGGFYLPLKTGKDFKKGTYSIAANVQGLARQFNHSIEMDYFQANELEISIRDLEEIYVGPRLPDCTVFGCYLSGNPMAGELLEYSINPIPINMVFHRLTNPTLHSFTFTLDDVFKEQRREINLKWKQRLDKNGRHRLKKEFKPLKKTHYATALKLEAIGVTTEGKEYKTAKNTLYLPGNKLIGVKIKENNDVHYAIEADLAVIDNSGRPTSARADIAIYNQNHQAGKKKLKLIHRCGRKTFKNLDKIFFNVKEKGTYFIKIDTYGDKSGPTSTSACFKADYLDSSPIVRELTLQAEQEQYHIGQQAKVVIHSPFQGKALVTVEQDHILDSFLLDINHTTPVSIKIKETYFPGFKMKVLAREGSAKFISKAVDFIVTKPGNRPLQVFIEPEHDEIRPSTKAKIRLKVTDHRGRPVISNLLVYCVDEGHLSLTRYQVPDMYPHFYHRKWQWDESKKKTFFSKESKSRFLINHPLLDIDIKGAFLFGRVLGPDGTGLAHVRISLSNKKGKIHATLSSPNGYYRFLGKHRPIQSLKLERKGYVTYIYKNDSKCCEPSGLVNFVMLPLKKGETSGTEVIKCKNVFDFGFDFGLEGGLTGGVEVGVLGAPGTTAALTGKSLIPGLTARPYFRANFQPVLFFKKIKTDAQGRGEVEFQTSDMMSTYRVMALAYNGSNFGKARGSITVSSDLLIKEALPEFAYQGDTFTAGAVISNRNCKPVSAVVALEPENIEITNRKPLKSRIKGLHNQSALFQFIATKTGTAHLKFSVESGEYKDGVIKKMPILDHRFDDSEIYYDTGKRIDRTLKLRPDYKKPVLKLTISPTIKNWKTKMSKVILSYPYGCMEQRTSKILPFLVLDYRLMEQMEVNITRDKIKHFVYEYLDRAEECITPDGGMTYYGEGEPSDYLTVYVLWAFHLARQKGYDVNPGMIARMTAYLERARLSPGKQSFLQFVKSTVKQADPEVLQRLYDQRKELSLMGKVFLYKALHYQLHDRSKTGAILEEFQQGLRVKGDEAWFHLEKTRYNRDLPFYNTRYLGALILQAILEVEGHYPYASHLMNRLVRVKSHCWKTTQVNFWILYALSQYMQSQCGKTAAVRVGSDHLNKVFEDHNDVFYYEKSLDNNENEIPIKIVSDGHVYAILQLNYQTSKPPARSRGIKVTRHIYDKFGKAVNLLKKGEIYQVEILVDADDIVPYGIIDAPLPAGVQLLRKDHVTTRELRPFNRIHEAAYSLPWLREEHERERTVFYTYELKKKTRVVYFVKALYAGTFTWMPTVVQGMYHPRFYGRTAGQNIMINKN